MHQDPRMLHRQPGAPAEHGAAQRHSGALPVTRPRAVPAGHPAPGKSAPGNAPFLPPDPGRPGPSQPGSRDSQRPGYRTCIRRRCASG